MSRKKNLQDLDEFERGYIEGKMNAKIRVEANDDIYQLKRLNYKIDIKCKNKKQKEFLNLLKNEDKKICFGVGSAGSGKSYISLAYALQALRDESTPYRKIIILIPPLQSCSSSLNIGLLPGNIDEKTMVFRSADGSTMEKILRNSGNFNEKTIVDNLYNSGKIEYQLVNFIRGCSYDDCIVLLNESEGYDKDEMLLLLTRIGENCKYIITGDEQQKSRRDMKNGSGMKHAVDSISDMDEIGIVEFTNEDIVRNPIIGKILEKW